MTNQLPIEMVDPHDLKLNPHNKRVYGDMAPPSDLLDSISHGWSPTSILEALPDGTLIKGHLRRFAAIQLHVERVPVLYRPDLTDDEAAQVEELLASNAGRQKTREIVAREWRLAFQTFKQKVGKVEGEKSRDVVGKRFGISGVTLEHGIAVVDALESRGLDIEVRDQVRAALEQRGVEPAWKLLRKHLSGSTESPLDDDSEGSEAEQVSMAIPAAKRHKALLDVLSTVEAREHLLADVEALALAIPREKLDDVLAQVQNTLVLLGNLEGEIRDRLDAQKRGARRVRR